jgi:AAA15 family ATPase/GTPase
MIERITLNKEKYSGYKLEPIENKITGLSKINIFIGQNNSGKSRFLMNLSLFSLSEMWKF